MWAYTQPPALLALRDPYAGDPKSFTGKDQTCLEQFVASCILLFIARPVSFFNDSSEVNYAISYPSEIAVHWIWSILL